MCSHTDKTLYSTQCNMFRYQTQNDKHNIRTHLLKKQNKAVEYPKRHLPTEQRLTAMSYLGQNLQRGNGGAEHHYIHSCSMPSTTTVVVFTTGNHSCQDSLDTAYEGEVLIAFVDPTTPCTTNGAYLNKRESLLWKLLLFIIIFSQHTNPQNLVQHLCCLVRNCICLLPRKEANLQQNTCQSELDKQEHIFCIF